MWKSRLDGLDVIPDVSKLATKLCDYAQTNQIVVLYQNKLSKVKRLNYYPDDNGEVIFRVLTKWSEEVAYSVAEMQEFIEKYGELIKSLKFEAFDKSLQNLVNFSESCDSSGVEWYTNIIVGDGSEAINTNIINQQSTYNPNVKLVL